MAPKTSENQKPNIMRYVGPVSTLAAGSMVNDKFKAGPEKDAIPLITGQTYPDQKAKLKALPLDHPTVKALIARNPVSYTHLTLPTTPYV